MTEIMIRTFYPIGQGAFYTEKHDNNINIVYDCGSKSNKNKVDKKIINSFNNEIINILFISHYDEDHINKIHLLIQNNTVNIVILPLLHNDERLLLYNFYLSIGFNEVASLINNPDSFFSDNTKIIYVSPDEDIKNDEDETSITLKELETNGITTLKNKTKILINEFWEYIPYNHLYTQRNEELINLLKANTIDVENLKSDLNYGLKNISTIRKIYKELSGNINENSLIVYSGPLENVTNHILLECPIFLNHWFINEKVACIFTGDTNFNIVNIKEVFKKKWKLVGTVQIPHHGSKKDFNQNFLSENSLICPISFGTENIFGHPYIKAIELITSNDSFPKLITENTDTIYIQKIKYIA
jgi:beta-lactamase superfamily II metal-dependent hydrolase